MKDYVIQQPAVEPVSLADCYAHLRLTPDPGSPLSHPDDAMLLRHIRTARADVENYMRRAIVKQRRRAVFGPDDRVRLGLRGGWGWGWAGAGYWNPWCASEGLPLRGGALAIESVSYYGGDNVDVVVDPASYFLVDSVRPSVQFVTGFGPGVYSRSDAVRVEYWAGFPPQGSPEEDLLGAVPAPICDAILIGVELLYEALDPAQRDRLEAAQQSLLDPYSMPVLA